MLGSSSRHLFRRMLHNNTGFAFDIDGVLLRSKSAIPGASDALNLLQKEKIPFILLTNGGGLLEKHRTEFLSDILKVDLSPLQLIQSHTPYKALVTKHKKVLCCGINSVREVAETYGFENVVHPIDILAHNKDVSPFSAFSIEQVKNVAKKHDSLLETPFDAILVFNDPHDWATDIQIISDLLNSDRGYLGTLRKEHNENPSIPIYFSNNDLLWANHYHLNRFGQGAFRLIIQSLYEQFNEGRKLQDTILGKPTTVTYDFAHHVLIDWRQKLEQGTCDSDVQILPPLGSTPENSPFERVFMVGDNPASDIIGAHQYGWESCLVRTGVYQDGDKLLCKPTMIVDNVFEAVVRSLEKVKS